MTCTPSAKATTSCLVGVRVPHDRGVLAHSDGDVVIHALCDAILGALALGDIGKHFPPSDPQWKGADSRAFLRHCDALARERGWRLGNCEVTVICERRKSVRTPRRCASCLRRTWAWTWMRSASRRPPAKNWFYRARRGIAAMAVCLLVKP
jgi:2-C-methyl-D-erythritol 2,4-cyclodiphosphate synthase